MDLDVEPSVAAALASGAPVVALESTIVAHGLPYPANFEVARELEAAVRDGGATPATIAVVRGRHRWRLLVKAPRELDLQAYLRAWLAALPKPPSDLRLTVDIDPYSFL